MQRERPPSLCDKVMTIRLPRRDLLEGGALLHVATEQLPSVWR